MIKKYNQYINESILDELKGPSKEEISNNFKQQFLDKKIRMLDYYNKSKQLGFSGPSDDEVMDYYIKIKNYDDLLYFSLRRFKLDMFKLAIEHGANTEDLLQEIYENDFSTEQFKQLFEIVDINLIPHKKVSDFFFNLYIDQREVIVNKLDFNREQLMDSILKELSTKTAYKTIDLFFKKGLPDNLIIFLLMCSYSNTINITLFKYIIENYEIPYHYNDDKLLHFIVNHNKYHRDEILKLLLDKDVNIYARNNQMINTIKEEKPTSDLYLFFKEKDKMNIL